jgi:tetratricopeptide (TPR) repeat protein
VSPVRDNPGEFALLASAQALSGDLPAAIQTLQRGIAAYPAEPELYFRLVLIFAEGRRDQDAQAVLQTASEQTPNSPLVDYGKALLAEMDGRDDEAVGWAERSLQIDGNQAELLGLLGTLYEQRGRTDEAVRTYEKALKRGASTYTAAKYADLLIRLQRFEEAETQLRELLVRFPGDPHLNREMGKLYRAEGKLRQAETPLRTSIRTDPADPQTHYVLAQVLRNEGRVGEADGELELFKKTKKKSESVRMLELNPGFELAERP